MFLMLGILSSLIGLFVPLITEQGRSLSLLEVDNLQKNIQEIFNQTTTYFSSQGIDVVERIKKCRFYCSI